MSERGVPAMLERLTSGVAGLDTILCDGFVRGGVYLFLAVPGAGKTILGNQICFRHVAAGGRAIFLTLLAESHARLIAQLRAFAFFDENCVGKDLTYIAGYDALEKDKLKGLISLVRQIVRDHKATLLVIDGIVTAGAVAESDLELKRFIHELQVFADLVGCTVLLLTGPSETGGGQYALRTMVDGLVEIHLDTIEMEAVRTIEVTKHRGSAAVLGRHVLQINEVGITIHPRTEAVYGKTIERPDPGLFPAAAFGIEALDAMLGGGLQAGSITLALGSPGSGKTLLGLSFLAAGARQGERGLYFGFSETPSDLCRKASAIGLELAEDLKNGLLEILWQSPLDAIADALAEKLIAHVQKREVRRIFIDGLGGFKDSLVYAARSARFFAALCNELRARGIVTLLSDETASVDAIEFPRHALTAMLDNIIVLRHVEQGPRIHKVLSLMKKREGHGEPSPREFFIGAQGFVVSPDSTGPSALPAPEGGRELNWGTEKGTVRDKPGEP